MEDPSFTLKPDKVVEIKTPLVESISFESQSHGVAELWNLTHQNSNPFPQLRCVKKG